MLLLWSPSRVLWWGAEEGSFITHQKRPLLLPLLSRKHIQSRLLLGVPLFFLKKVLLFGEMLYGVNK